LRSRLKRRVHVIKSSPEIQSYPRATPPMSYPPILPNSTIRPGKIPRGTERINNTTIPFGKNRKI
jgi:hypothetical protein